MDVKNLKDIDDKIGNAFKTNKEIAINQLEQIISKMPIEIKTLINDAFALKRIPKEYLLSSILFAYSNACGLAFSIKAMGYINYANLYFSIIGSRGDIKSPAMDLATFPLVKYDNEKYKEFKKNNIELEETEKSDRKQLFLQDATIESAIFTHYKNKYSIGIFIDELYFIIEKMANKSSTEGTAWRTFFLQGNTNKYIDISRKINTETIEIAILILEFYFINFKIVLDENINKKEKLPTTEDIIRLAIKNNASQKDVVAITGMNKSSISRKWNNELMQLAT
ncbi:DUF3987 domain-containing protein [Flavobacterium sp. GT3R68]|uniref:DUF3987 domain-containing protein n=1 Tax=Flavobacterium sp. GT3R68 TaxID=2594437 RepID=UPI000F87AFDA|nr:DUF3987 domain-containing protein [Flavobacterium sp. GT3R68]RTY90595.1 DUF3987 domain-containing protein [Flavobacterium sp. GSN2]TRW89879.1 DUF3987 domain-containing protein [Flavobacterium sp. GT3R68]